MMFSFKEFFLYTAADTMSLGFFEGDIPLTVVFMRKLRMIEQASRTKLHYKDCSSTTDKKRGIYEWVFWKYWDIWVRL